MLRKQCPPFAGTVARTPSLPRPQVSTGAGEGRRDAFGKAALLWLRLPLPNFAWIAQPEGQTRELLSYQFQFMGR